MDQARPDIPGEAVTYLWHGWSRRGWIELEAPGQARLTQRVRVSLGVDIFLWGEWVHPWLELPAGTLVHVSRLRPTRPEEIFSKHGCGVTTGVRFDWTAEPPLGLWCSAPGSWTASWTAFLPGKPPQTFSRSSDALTHLGRAFGSPTYARLPDLARSPKQGLTFHLAEMR